MLQELEKKYTVRAIDKFFYSSAEDLTCQDIRCDYNADCIQRSRNSPQCFCRPGFQGNGTVCVPVDYRTPKEYSTVGEYSNIKTYTS